MAHIIGASLMKRGFEASTAMMDKDVKLDISPWAAGLLLVTLFVFIYMLFSVRQGDSRLI
jgi:hypothetical protein